MSELVMCSRPTPAELITGVEDLHNRTLHGLTESTPSTLSPYTPYILSDNLNIIDRKLITRLSSPKTAKELTDLSLSLGEDNTTALIGLTQKIHEFNLGLIGTSTSIYASRLGSFSRAVKDYQHALMEYRKVIKSDSVTKMEARRKATEAFQRLQFRFRSELNAINSGVRARKGTPLSSVKRATNIANSSRNVTKLNVSSQIQAHNLVRFTQHAKFLGNGLAVIDFTSRIGNISNEYQSDGDWERELFIESSSFALSAAAGSVTIKTGVAALGLLVVATPIGWVGLVIGGAAVAGAAAATAIATNNIVKENSGGVYDSIMKWVSSR